MAIGVTYGDFLAVESIVRIVQWMYYDEFCNYSYT